MKIKALFICIILIILSITISCFSYYTFNDTKIESMVTRNTIFQKTAYQIYENTDLPYQQYGLMCRITIKDSVRRSEKHYALLEKFSVIQKGYCAYDPGKVEEYSLNDSIQAISIQSLYDFNDVSAASNDLVKYFNLGYKGDYSWNLNDSITNLTTINNIAQLNGVLTKTDRYFDIISLILTLKEKPKYEKQQFIVNLLFKSGHFLRDTTRIINLK